MNITRNIGMLLLSIYLILAGVSALAAIGLPPVVMGVLSVAAGICILIGK